jgi:hypothetical protein
MEARASAADANGSKGNRASPGHQEKINKTTPIITVAPFKLGTLTLQTTATSQQI